jgi:hypothetical protein
MHDRMSPTSKPPTMHEAGASPIDAAPPVAVAATASSEADPPPIQFGLKTLFVLLSLCGVLFAVLGRLSVVWGIALVWLVLLIAAHFAASAVGTRASAHAPSRRRLLPHADGDLVATRPAFAPTTRLGGRAQLGSRFNFVIGAGSIVGCIVGTTLVALHNGARLGAWGLLLAAVSSAGIGAFCAFLAGSCAKVTSKAWTEATRDLEARRSRQN